MTEGYVSSEGLFLVRLQVADSEKNWHEFEAAIDTGFSGYLTLPTAQITEWKLAFFEESEFILGDEREVMFNTYSADAIFAGQEYEILVLETDSDPPLIGYKLLKGHRMEADIVDNGKMLVKKIET